MSHILVVGGGIAGATAAAHLAPLGEVTLIEAEDAPGYHASGRSAAMFEENYGSASTVALNRAGRAYLDAAGVLSPRGMLMVGTPDDADAFAADCATLHLDPVALDEAVRMVPILDRARIDRAAWHDTACDIDTDLLLQGFLRTARQHGARILTRAAATAIARRDGRWRVETPLGEFVADIVVNAAGAWADRVAEMAGVRPLGLTPCRRSMARIPAPGGHDLSGWPMLFGPGETWYAKPDAGKLLVSPADEDPVAPHDAWADDMTLAEGIARYEAVVTETVTRVEHSWAGLRTFAPDRSLVIGFDREMPGFFWLAGQGGYGIQTSPAAGRLTADLIAGRTPDLDAGTVAALSPGRFRGG